MFVTFRRAIADAQKRYSFAKVASEARADATKVVRSTPCEKTKREKVEEKEEEEEVKRRRRKRR